jgi:hypothetical protein
MATLSYPRALAFDSTVERQSPPTASRERGVPGARQETLSRRRSAPASLKHARPSRLHRLANEQLVPPTVRVRKANSKKQSSAASPRKENTRRSAARDGRQRKLRSGTAVDCEKGTFPSSTEEVDLTQLRVSCWCRPPDWRYHFAQRIAHGLQLARSDGDRAASILAKLLHRWSKAKSNSQQSAVVQRFSDLFEAWQLYQMPADSGPRLDVECLLLAGASDAEVSAYSGHTPASIRLFHDCFFDIRSRMGKTIVVHIAVNRDCPDSEANIIRGTALCRGKEAALALLQPSFPGKLNNHRELSAYMAADRRTTLAAKAMLAIRMMDMTDVHQQVIVVRAAQKLEQIEERHRLWREEQARSARDLIEGMKVCNRLFERALGSTWTDLAKSSEETKSGAKPQSEPTEAK